MSRRNLTIGVSLKMYLGYHETIDWCSEVARVTHDHPAIREGLVDMFVLPSSPMIRGTVEVLAPVGISVGAQNLWSEDSGPFTGEVSGTVLKEAGCEYVAVGHAERRALFSEDDQLVAAKLAAALRNDLIPVLCVGEADETSPEQASRACIDELRSVIQSVGEASSLAPVIAYEPVWAIGRSDPAAPEHTRAVAGELREWLGQQDATSESRLIYGGSASLGLLSALSGVVDGLFLGRFAHDPEILAGILDEAVALVVGH